MLYASLKSCAPICIPEILAFHVRMYIHFSISVGKVPVVLVQISEVHFILSLSCAQEPSVPTLSESTSDTLRA